MSNTRTENNNNNKNYLWVISVYGVFISVFFSSSDPQCNNGKKQQHHEIVDNGLVPVGHARRARDGFGGMVVGQGQGQKQGAER